MPVKSDRLWMFAVLWGCFIVRGCFYAMAVPLWEPVDEYSHFAYVEHAGLGEALITESNTVPPDVTASFELVPLPKALIESLTTGSHWTYELYWGQTAKARQASENKLFSIPPAAVGTLESRWLPIYERQQPPLYYWLMSPVYRTFRNASLPDRVVTLRFAGILLASFVVPITFVVGTRLGGSVPASAAAALLVSMPQLIITASRVGNEALAIGVGAGIVWAAVRLSEIPTWRNALLLGFALSAGLFTKAYFLSAFGIVLLWFVLRFGVESRRRVLILPILLLPAITAGWWYVRNVRLTGSLSGEQVDAASRALSWPAKLHAAFTINWWRTLDSLMISHTYALGWSIITVRAWMYHLVSLLWLIAVIGVVVYLIRARGHAERSVVGLSAAIGTGMLVTLAYHAFVSFIVLHQAATSGSYLFSVATAEAVLLVAGLRYLQRRYWAQLIAFACLLLATIDLFGMNVYVLPYYAGFLVHSPSGTLPAWKIGEAAKVGGLLFERLSMNKPEWVGTGIMAVVWLLYMVATVAVPVVLVFVFRRLKKAVPG